MDNSRKENRRIQNWMKYHDMVPMHSHAPDANKPSHSALRLRKTPANAKFCNMLNADLMTQLRRFGGTSYLFRWKCLL